MNSLFGLFSKDHAMSLPEGSQPAVDPSKKRRLASDSASDSDAPAKSAISAIAKSKKKVRKLESPTEAGPSLKESQIRRIAAQSHYDVVSKSLASMEARKDPNYVPIYKKKMFVDSPKSDDPYAIPDQTPDHYRPKVPRAKPLVSVVSTGSSEEMTTPEPPKNKQKRHTQSSPHPGALFKGKKKISMSSTPPSSASPRPISPIFFGTDCGVPSVGFNSLCRLSSPRSYVQLPKQTELISTPVKIPTQRGLRPSGMSTSALGHRRPVEVDVSEVQSTSEMRAASTSPVKRMLQRNNVEGTSTERRVLSRDSPLRRQRSCSVGSLSDVRETDAEPFSQLTPLPKKERSRSVERQPVPSELTSFTRTLRETPERTRLAKERGLEKSASSGSLNRLDSMPVVTRGMSRAMSTNDLSKPKQVDFVETGRVESKKEEQVADPVFPKAVEPPKPGSQSSEYHSPMKLPLKPAIVGVTEDVKPSVSIPMDQDSECSEYFSVSSTPSSPVKAVETVTNPEDEVVPCSQDVPPSDGLLLKPPPPVAPPDQIPPVPSSDLVTQPSSSSTLSQEDVVPCSQEDSLSQDVVECSQPTQTPEPPSQDVVASSQVLDATYSQEVVPCSQETMGDVILSSQDSCSPARLPSGSGENHQPLPLKSALKTPGSENRKNGRRIQFSSLQVYYFGRIQGFHVVPDHGDVALGMESVHFNQREFKVLRTHRPGIDMNDPEESDLSEDEDPGVDRFFRRSDFERNNNERQRMLHNNGVVVSRQKHHLDMLRQLRKDCGCSCRGGICRPETCECSKAGIPCQVDRQEADGRLFPCTCRFLCRNENGRLVYDYDKVHEERRKTIQIYKDMQKTGIYSSPRVKRFSDNEEEEEESDEVVSADTKDEELNTKTPTREDFLLAPRVQGTPVYKATNQRPPNNNEPPSTPTTFFPRSQSLL